MQAATFKSSYASVAYTGQLGTSTFAFGPTSLIPASEASTIKLAADGVTGTAYQNIWVLTDNVPGFTPTSFNDVYSSTFSQVATLPAASDRDITRVNNITSDSVTVLNTVFAERLTTDAAYRFGYVNYARWRRVGGGSGRARTDLLVFGTPSSASDRPTTGTRTYTALVRGYDLAATDGQTGGTETAIDGMLAVTVDYAAGTVAFTLTLNLPTGGATVPIVLTGAGSLTSANGLSGAVTGAGPTGRFTGALFGPGAAELGLAVSLSGATGAGPTLTQHRTALAIVGK